MCDANKPRTGRWLSRQSESTFRNRLSNYSMIYVGSVCLLSVYQPEIAHTQYFSILDKRLNRIAKGQSNMDNPA